LGFPGVGALLGPESMVTVLRQADLAGRAPIDEAGSPAVAAIHALPAARDRRP
jgi:hypothetical protein